MAEDPTPPQMPDESAAQGQIVRLAAWLVVAGLVIAGLYVGRDVVIPLAIALLISFALAPFVAWLARRGLSRVLSVCAVMLAISIVIAGLGLLVSSQVRVLSVELPAYQTTIRTKIDDLATRIKAPGIFDGALNMLENVQKDVSDAVAGEQQGALGAQRVRIVADPVSPFKTALAWLIPVLEPLAKAGIVIVFIFLILLDRNDLRDRLIRLLGANLHRSTDAMEEAGRRISRYLLMQLTVNVIYAIPMSLGLYLIGVPGWILWGILAAVLRFVPYIGPMLLAIFPITVAFAVDPGWSMVLWSIALIGGLELILGNIVEPLLYGTSTGLSAISLIAAATFWTALWGPVGLILSTPLTVCLLVIGRNLPQLRFLDTLLGSTPVLDVPTRVYQRLIADDPEEAIEIAEAEIAQSSVLEFYNDTGIEVLRQASDDHLRHASAGHRLRLANGIDALLDNLRADFPVDLTEDAPARVVAIAGKWDIDQFACAMLAHALGLAGIAADDRAAGLLTARHVDGLDLDRAEVIVLGYFSRDPQSAIRAFCRRLRSRWPDKTIILALWNAPEPLLDPKMIERLGADEVVTSLSEAVLRIQQLVAPQETRAPEVAAPDDEDARVEALIATEVLDGHARGDLDALAKRAADVFDVKFAVISAIDRDHEHIVGQNVDLPGRLTRDGAGTVTLPRAGAIGDHVVTAGKTLVVSDIERDPRFAENPATRLWHMRFFAGAPLCTAKGRAIGTLCLLDSEPRKLTEAEITLLETLAGDIVSALTGDDAAAPETAPASTPAGSTLGQPVPD